MERRNAWLSYKEAEETEMEFRELMLVPKGISSVQGQIRAAGEIDSLFRKALNKRNGREGSTV